jgi:tripartite-type tricarboxylate transporter receptor subunit TctC
MKKKILAALALVLGASTALAQAWPDKPIRLIVPFPPGGGTDILSRLVGARLSENTKWTIVIDNRAGAGGTIGIAQAAKTAPTGYDLVMGQKDNLAVAPWLYKGLSYDPVRDFAPVAHVAYTPIVFVTSAKSRFKTFADVVAAAKAAPDTITYGSPGNGTTIHLAGEMVNITAGIKLRHIPYKGSNPAMTDAIAGAVDLMVSSVPSAMSQIRAGTVRALAVTSAKRSSSLPDVPTVAESGYPGVDVSTWYGVLVPTGTPPAIAARVHDEVNKLLATPAFRDAIVEQGAEPLAMSAEQFGALIKSDYAKSKDIVARSGAKLE